MDGGDGAVIILILEKNAVEELPGFQKVRFDLQRLFGRFFGLSGLLIQQVAPGQEQPGLRVLGPILGEETETVHRSQTVLFFQGDNPPGFGGEHVLGVSLEDFIYQLLGRFDMVLGKFKPSQFVFGSGPLRSVGVQFDDFLQHVRGLPLPLHG